MPDKHSLDEMRRRIQESLIQAKQEQLRDEFGMQIDYADPNLIQKFIPNGLITSANLSASLKTPQGLQYGNGLAARQLSL